MKLRIRNNSIRLRLTQSEVAQFGENGYVEEAIEFGGAPASRLTYALISLPENDSENDIASKFENSKITISVPSPQARQWVDSDQVGIETDQDIGGNKLRILVEKDFACAAPRDGEDDSDAFPNPNLPVC